jgi:cellulose synthase (UDP-forming)
MLFNISFYVPILLAIGIPLCFILLLGARNPFTRIVLSVSCIFLAIRYIMWRYTMSMPQEQEWWQDIWAWCFFFVETCTILSSVFAYFFMSRRKDRSRDADNPIAPENREAPVAVFICTYNENYQILERTLVGATSVQHPNITVWLCDDGNRAWAKELAEEFGAKYCPRIKGTHAKAGNFNNALWHALQTDNPPKFILLLDADFVASKNIVQRILPLFNEPDVGIVQTPQHFFNPDPIQTNLLCVNSWPDEQRFFFNELLPCKDAWGAAFCCGTSAMFRVEALVKAGGMATETVTEDMLTTFRLGEYGYRTVFLNERLSLGLAPEGLAEYIGQRGRWCLGAIQQVYTKWSPWGRAKVSLINRISCFDGIMHWTFGFLFKIMMMLAPAIYWWTGSAVMASTVEDMLEQLAPYLLCVLLFMYCLAGNRVLPIMTDVSHLICAPAIVRSVVTGYIKPYGQKFKVTAKGTNSEKVVVQWRLLMPFLFVALMTISGMVINMQAQSSLYGTPGFTINVFWSVFNVFVLVSACMVCVELPRKRKDERFPANEWVTFSYPGFEHGRDFFMSDISVGGALLVVSDHGEMPAKGIEGILRLNDGTEVQAQVLGAFADNKLPLKFHQDKETRRYMTRRIFSGLYSNEVEEVRPWKSFLNILKKIFW